MNILDNLEKLNFTRLEAQLYIALLGEKPMSAYQLAKKVNISRPSIYNALDHMLDKGMVEVIPNETLLYVAQEPSVILEKMHFEMQNNLHKAKKELEIYKGYKYDEVYLNFRGFNTAIYKTKEILKEAEGDVYINVDCDISCLSDELNCLVQKGVKVVVFSFYEIENRIEGVRYFSHKLSVKDSHIHTRLMIAVDNCIALAANGNGSFETWSGIVSNNKLFIRIITEHIHNDIYMLKIRDKYGKEVYDEYLYLNTDFEKRNREEEV